MTIDFHYAMQTCDVASYQNLPRYCGNDRSLLTQKSITSFLNSVSYVAETKKETIHHVCVIDDNSTKETQNYINRAIAHYTKSNLTIEFKKLETSGISNSIRSCYHWLEQNGKDFVYQVQDDYIFLPNTILNMASIWFQMYNETKSHAVVTPYHDTYIWLQHYRNKSTPRAFILGSQDFWIQTYDVACTFFTSKQQFSQHWDLYNDFFYLIDNKNDKGDLENKSLNYMFTRRAILGLMPVRSLALHMQTELEKDPYIDWQPWWESIQLI